jgi:hypothetical protein
VVPCEAVRTCRPCYPGGHGRAGQLSWLPVAGLPLTSTGSAPSVLVTRLRLGSLHAAACAVARVRSDAPVRELSASGYPSRLPQATWALCQLPGPDLHRRVTRYPRHTDVAPLLPFRHGRQQVPGAGPRSLSISPVLSARQGRAAQSVACLPVLLARRGEDVEDDAPLVQRAPPVRHVRRGLRGNGLRGPPFLTREAPSFPFPSYRRYVFSSFFLTASTISSFRLASIL